MLFRPLSKSSIYVMYVCKSKKKRTNCYERLKNNLLRINLTEQQQQQRHAKKVDLRSYGTIEFFFLLIQFKLHVFFLSYVFTIFFSCKLTFCLCCCAFQFSKFATFVEVDGLAAIYSRLVFFDDGKNIYKN